MTLTVELDGVEDVVGALRSLNLSVRQHVKDVVNETALNIQTRARQLCPVDTGRLRASIRTLFFAAGLAAEVSTDVFYAPFVEYGTGQAGAGSGVTPPSTYRYGPSAGGRAQPFLFPAYAIERPAFVWRLNQALHQSVREAT